MISIGFSRAIGFKPFSKLICLFERTKYSHVYIKVYNKYFNEYDIYQASKCYVNHITDSIFLESNHVVREFVLKIDENKKLQIISFLRTKLGKPYSIKTVFIILLKKFGINLNRYADGEEAYICSELVARVIKEYNIMDLEFNVDTATPKQLYDIIEKMDTH